MLLHCPCPFCAVLKINGPFENAQEQVRHTLEGRRGAVQADWHDFKFVQAVGCEKGGLRTDPFLDTYLKKGELDPCRKNSWQHPQSRPSSIPERG